MKDRRHIKHRDDLKSHSHDQDARKTEDGKDGMHVGKAEMSITHDTSAVRA